jgi:2-hydroxy-3-keto-5-methylthiopentenyl-1-phosphate phosphatase|tara:strand:- start:12092 stop:12751 length:660 start_codon:yes stop_codon:yes gene_type:complete
MIKKNILLVIDFDDTLVTKNAAQVVLNKFIPNDYKEISSKYKKGEINFRIYQEDSFKKALEQTSILEIEEYSKNNVEIRSGFKELIDYSKNKNIKIIILSSGIKSYIEPVINNYQNNLTLIAADMEKATDSKVSFSYNDSYNIHCSNDWGICKCKTVESLKNKNFIIYIGDGITTDFCASQKCDVIFALDPLYNKCLKEKINAKKFEGFNNLLKYIKKL